MHKLNTYLTLITIFLCSSLFGPVGVFGAEDSARTGIVASHEIACQKFADVHIKENHLTQNHLEQALTDSNLDAEKIFNLINTHRSKLQLPSFEKEEGLCQLAESRKSELRAEILSGNIHQGIRARNLPYLVVENMKLGRSEEDVVGWWLLSPLHKKSIENGYKYSCGACQGNICIQLFTNYIANKSI